ncbi:DUF6115 domain-containing protein [Paenibacillus spongiae]|uniref:DUF2802 domain-containing protein n=1 Tax=Paenibacillus spongiae TaxID=2909671 RepID=A0ABY5SEY3_9BACL|nr:hypothetical protein [Paenibacillus spongiae]UVI32526.1 hypothetical protein L1F29_12160 [Paenibacillus spongiae]
MDPWHYIVLLGAVVVVFGFIQPRKHAPAPEDNMAVRNMETALEQFMENMEADNRDMVNLVAKVQQDSQSQAKLREARIDQLESRCAELEQSLSQYTRESASQPAPSGSLEKLAYTAEAPEELPILRDEAQVQDAAPTIRTRYSELFELYDSGKSVEAIAKKLSLNKGEVQLILQLSRQEETNTR